MGDVEAAPAQKSAPVLEPSKIIPLDSPIEVGGITTSCLVLREPTAGEMEDIEAKSGMAWSNALVGQVTGLLPIVIRKVPIRVLNEAVDYLLPFTTNVRPTGPDA